MGGGSTGFSLPVVRVGFGLTDISIIPLHCGGAWDCYLVVDDDVMVMK